MSRQVRPFVKGFRLFARRLSDGLTIARGPNTLKHKDLTPNATEHTLKEIGHVASALALSPI
jgi:hypothetical protein